MALDITGTLIRKLPLQSGSSARGEWQKQEFVMETHENFPRKVCLSVWGADKVAELASCREGETLRVSFNAESREYNERWYTDLRAWRIERAGTSEPNEENSASGVPASTPSSPSEDIPDMGEDDLPF